MRVVPPVGLGPFTSLWVSVVSCIWRSLAAGAPGWCLPVPSSATTMGGKWEASHHGNTGALLTSSSPDPPLRHVKLDSVLISGHCA